jgi:hypothetical protein
MGVCPWVKAGSAQGAFSGKKPNPDQMKGAFNLVPWNL